MKKLVRPVQKVNTASVGLDVHEQVIVYARLDRHGNEAGKGSIRSRPKALVQFLSSLEEPTHVAFEAGGSTFWVYDVLVAELGADFVHVAQPKRIRAIANSTQKNDSNDAWWLAYLTYEGRLPECFIATGELRELRIAVRERFALVQRITEVKVRLKSHLRQMGITLPARKVDSIRGWNFLVDLAEERSDVQGRAVAQSLALLEHMLAAREEWEEVIEELAESFPAVRTLKAEMPGVGPTLAAVLVAELGPMERFTSAKAMGRFAGLTPSDRSSAGKTRYGSITREGSEHLRWALTQAAMACTRSRSGPGLAAGNWIRAKQRRMGSKGKARVAAARKIAESIWRLFHWGECFDPAKPFGGMPAAAN
jgi:transposase